MLEEAGHVAEAEGLRGFVAENREALVLLEDAYSLGRYGLPGYTRREAEKGVRAAERLVELLHGFLGHGGAGE